MSKLILLLTGGSGMVGRNILENPKANNWDIIAPSSASLDLTQPEAVDAFVLKLKPEVIIHAAGHVGGIQVNMSIQSNSLSVMLPSVVILWLVIRLVFISSSIWRQLACIHAQLRIHERRNDFDW